MFASADHNIKMFSKIATFLPNHYTKKLIFDLVSQLSFKVYSTNYRLFSDESVSVQYVQLIIVFILKKLNFMTCDVTFYPAQKW